MITAMLLSSTTSAVLNTNKGQFCNIDVRLQLERKSESFCMPAISAAMAYTAYVWQQLHLTNGALAASHCIALRHCRTPAVPHCNATAVCVSDA
jgi:hypothetical protein